jgi:hypothetical protein
VVDGELREALDELDEGVLVDAFLAADAGEDRARARR